MSNHTWKDIAQYAKQHRDASLEKVTPAVPVLPEQIPLDVTKIPKQLLTKEETGITEKATEELLPLLASGKLTSASVIQAFLRRAAIAQKLVNCVTELLPERAHSRAKFLDEYLAEHKKPIGPLHGLPISVKEHVIMKDLGVNAGFASWWPGKGEEDAPILRILWNAGCVFYARTTEPQTLMHLETSSNLYGVTVNPFNTDLTAGGSSGGEGALIGLRGSCLGIGTDIGGSIRSPAANNGVYGFKPTSNRLPILGISATMLGAEHILPAIGPLSTSLEGIKIFNKTILAAKPWLEAPSLLPFPWKDDQTYLPTLEGKKKLKIGVIWNDEVVKPHPPIVRALKEVTERLKTIEGIEIVDWKPLDHAHAWEIIASLYFCDGGSEETAAIEASGEPWMSLSEFIIKDNPHVKRRSIEEVWEWTAKREAYRDTHAKHWTSTATGKTSEGLPDGMVDVILCPVGPGAAPPLNCSRYWCYTSQWNLLDYPALVFPVSKVDKEVDGREEGYQPVNEKDEYNYKLYDPEKYHGAPISLQLVGRRYEDEKVVEALEYIKEKIGLPFASYI